MKDKTPDWAKQEVEDAKASRKAEKAYNDAMVNTPPAPKTPKKYAGGGAVKGYGAARGGKKCKMY